MNAGSFKKGHATWNKGKPHPAGRNHANFKPGNRPQTWRPNGSERMDRDGIWWTKVSDTRVKARDWKAQHVGVWEWWHARRLPRGWIVVFADRDRTNFDPENLIAVTRAENMRRNSYHRYPYPIPQLIQLRGALQRQINRRDRNEANRGFEGAPVRGTGRPAGQGQADGDRPREGHRGRGARGGGQREGRG